MEDKNLKNKCGTRTDKKGTDPQSPDVYHNTECHIEDSNVAVPTDEAVEDAKEWVDDENRR